VVFKVIPDVNSVVAQLRTGELDLAVVTANHRDTLASAPNLAFKVTVLPSTFYLALNNARWPFTDRLVRHALMHGLNRDLIVQRLVRGDAPVAAGPYADAFGSYVNKDLKPYPYDVGRAKALLAEAGFKPGADGVLQKDGKRLAFSLMVDKGNPEREQIALYTQQSWKQLGADVKADVEEWSVYISATRCHGRTRSRCRDARFSESVRGEQREGNVSKARPETIRRKRQRAPRAAHRGVRPIQ
jgi:peptide/nickel transport system substrate-binding protein